MARNAALQASPGRSCPPARGWETIGEGGGGMEGNPGPPTALSQATPALRQACRGRRAAQTARRRPARLRRDVRTRGRRLQRRTGRAAFARAGPERWAEVAGGGGQGRGGGV